MITVKEEPFSPHLSGHRNAVGPLTPVWPVELDAVPGPLRLAEKLAEALVLAFGLHGSQQSARGEQRHEAVHVGMLRAQRPIEPTRFVVLAVGIVVAALGAPYFVAHDNHGHTQREHRRGEEVLHLPVSQFLDRRDHPSGPRCPQFQLRLSFAPSRLSSPFASLCFSLYETRSFSVKPS